MYNIDNIKLVVDTTTYCNARCPQCHRNNDNDLRKSDWLPLRHWSLDDFKTAFPKKIIEKASHINFTPTWGDAGMNPHTSNTFKYIIECNNDIKINMDTNGSMRDPDFWFRLSGISQNINVNFAVDGIDQEMHSRYRRNTNLQKVLNNMNAFSSGLGTATAQSIIFKHNQDFIDEIKKLCFEYGAVSHSTVVSDRFDSDKIKNYFDSYTGETVILEEANINLEDGIIARA